MERHIFNGVETSREKYVLTLEDREELEKSLNKALEDYNDAAQAGYLSGSEQDGHHDEGFQLSKRNTEVLFAQIQQIRDVINNSRVITPEEQENFVALGNGIVIEYENDKSRLAFIMSGYVGGSSDIRRKISIKSPLGKALIGKKAGDIIDVKLPSGLRRVKIVKILSPSKALEAFN
ncbi:GreA/GreB family elongation factor [Patescibacteria group bacterium]|nr:GreA/GreB family elongation factor [Patescibacteria group bacterium]